MGIPIFEYTASVATFEGIQTYKATNIRELATLLNISRSSIAFILNKEGLLQRFIKIEKKPIVKNTPEFHS